MAHVAAGRYSLLAIMLLP